MCRKERGKSRFLRAVIWEKIKSWRTLNAKHTPVAPHPAPKLANVPFQVLQGKSLAASGPLGCHTWCATMRAWPYLPDGQAGEEQSLCTADPWQSILALPWAFPPGYCISSTQWPCNQEAEALAASSRPPLVVCCSLANCRGFLC